MTKKIIFIALFLFQKNLFAQSQQPEGFYFFAGLGTKTHQLSNLNNQLSASNLPTFKNYSLTLPTRLSYVSKKMVSLESNILDNLFNQNNKGSTSLHQTISLIHIGYDISKNLNFRLYPTVGFGNLNYSTEIGFNSTKNISFEDALKDYSNANRLKFTNKSKIIDLGFEWQKLDLPIPLSIKSGYQFALTKSSEWQSDLKLTNMPKDNLSSFYIKVYYGIGKNRK
jgi:hypothetical protein